MQWSTDKEENEISWAEIYRFLNNHSTIFFMVLIFSFVFNQSYDFSNQYYNLNAIDRYVFTEHCTINDIRYDFDPVEEEKHNFSHCPPCHIDDLNESEINSTRRDGIITVAMSGVYNIFPFVRTLRSTGSRASVFILFDDASYRKLSNDTFQLFKNCSVHAYNIGTLPPYKNYNDVFARKHVMIFDFIYKMASHLDRVLLADLYDSVFQTDPFLPTVDPDAFTITHEARKTGHDYYNKIRVKPLIQYNPATMDNMQTLNAGLMYGGPDVIMKYQNFYFHHFNIYDIANTHISCDQGYLNAFYLTNQLEPVLNKVNYWYNKEGFETLASIVSRLPRCLQFGKLKYGDTRAVIVHQFDRSSMLTAMVILACPKRNYHVYQNSYTRIDSNRMYNQVIKYLNESFTN